ncbi:MAG: hypothetical protein HQK51_16285, partial [Oligoflexia bacterium]|nr:hypothetical protein [Oligoflexia bacterium]
FCSINNNSYAYNNVGEFKIHATISQIDILNLRLNILLGKHINPSLYTIYHYIFETLLVKDAQTNEWKANLAKEYKISDDKLAIEFTLRENVMWHDNFPFSAEDVKFTFDYITENKTSNLELKNYFRNIKNILIIDKFKIKIYFYQKHFQNFQKIALFPILPKHKYINGRVDSKVELALGIPNTIQQTLIGTGAYQLEGLEIKRDERVSNVKQKINLILNLKKNKNWWGDSDVSSLKKFNFEKVIIKIVNSDNIALELFERGELDFIMLNKKDYDHLKSINGNSINSKIDLIKTQNKTNKTFSLIVLNLKKEMFSDKKIRKGLSLLIDRDKINKNFYESSVHTLVAPFDPFVATTKINLNTGNLFSHESNFGLSRSLQDEATSARNDIDKIAMSARTTENLDRANVADSLKEANIFLNKNNKTKKNPLSFTILVNNSIQADQLSDLQLKAKKIGVKIDVEQLSWKELWNRVIANNFDAFYFTYKLTDNNFDPMPLFHSKNIKKEMAEFGIFNYSKYKNQEVDSLLEKLSELSFTEQDTRLMILEKINKIITEDMPVIFLLYDDNQYYAKNKKIKSFTDSSPYDLGVDYWWSSK